MKIKLLGLGHSMRGDDEVGLIILQRWIDEFRSNYPDDIIEAEILESPGKDRSVLNNAGFTVGAEMPSGSARGQLVADFGELAAQALFGQLRLG